MRQRSVNLEALSHSAPIPLACRVGPILATSGVMGRNAETGEMPAEVAGQVEHCFRNLVVILAEAGMDLGDVVKFTFFAESEESRDAINAVWLRHYPDPAHRPARHTQIIPLRGKVRIQLDVLAVAKELT